MNTIIELMPDNVKFCFEEDKLWIAVWSDEYDTYLPPFYIMYKNVNSYSYGRASHRGKPGWIFIGMREGMLAWSFSHDRTPQAEAFISKLLEETRQYHYTTKTNAHPFQPSPKYMREYEARTKIFLEELE